MKTWRGHNKEWNIHTISDRRCYLEYLQKELAEQPNTLLAFVLMANHVHEIYLINDPPTFSRMMRKHHSRYGSYFNRQYQRCGKVAQDRPHTTLIQNDAQAMAATFYLLANPLRAGVCRDLRSYPFSSYNYYAFGQRIKDMPSHFLPDWYLALGSTPRVQQRCFRRLFFAYLRLHGIIKLGYSRLPFLGDPAWMEEKLRESRLMMKETRVNSPPVP